MNVNINPKLTTKDYLNCFSVSLRTAQRMVSSDKTKHKKKFLTALDFYKIYGFEIMPINPKMRHS